MAIKGTFRKLLEERPLNRIKVKDIVDTCGINRNTFYYHYPDLPALIEEFVKEGAESIIRKCISAKSVLDGFDAMTEYAIRRKRVIMHVFNSLSREVFEKNLMYISEFFVRRMIEMAQTQKDLSPPNAEAIIEYYKCVCFGLTINWLEKGMIQKQEQSIRRVFVLEKNMIMENSQHNINQI